MGSKVAEGAVGNPNEREGIKTKIETIIEGKHGGMGTEEGQAQKKIDDVVGDKVEVVKVQIQT